MAESEVVTKASDKVFAFLGRLAVVIGVVIAAITLWNLISAPKGRLIGTVQYAPFYYPPETEEYIAKTLRHEQVRIRQAVVDSKVIATSSSGPEKPVPSYLTDILNDPEFLVKSFRDRRVLVQDERLDIMRVVIRNDGDDTLKGVRLLVPTQFYSAMIRRVGRTPEIILSPYVKGRLSDSPSTPEQNDSLDSLDIGEMAPSSAVGVVVFTPHLIFSDFDAYSRPRLIHESGTGTVIMPAYLGPTAKWVTEPGNAFLIVGIVMVLVGVVSIARRTMRIQAQSQVRARVDRVRTEVDSSKKQ